MQIAKFIAISVLALSVDLDSAAACGGGETAAEHAANPRAQSLSRLRGNLRAIKNNHMNEKSTAKAIRSLRVAIARRASVCKKESRAALQLRAARQRAASGWTAGYIPRKQCQ